MKEIYETSDDMERTGVRFSAEVCVGEDGAPSKGNRVMSMQRSIELNDVTQSAASRTKEVRSWLSKSTWDIASPAVEGSKSCAKTTTNMDTMNRAHAPMASTRMPSQRFRNVE